VMAEHHYVEGYDINKINPINFKMVDTIQDVCKNKDIIFIALPTPIKPIFILIFVFLNYTLNL
jgi:hypothetical protein